MDLHQASRAEPAPGRKTTTLLRDRDLALPVTTIHGNRPGPRVLLKMCIRDSLCPDPSA